MVKKLTTAAMILLSALFVALQIMSLIGCKKETKGEAENADKAAAMNTISTNGSFPCNMPTVENGILTFTDTTQYLCYENFLTAFVDGNDSTTNTAFAGMSEDEKLAYVENMLGFQSLRAEKLAAFEEQNAVGWPTSEAIPDEDWIASRIRRSMLNNKREVKIGGYIEKHVSPEYLITLNASQPDLLMALRALPDNPAVEQILNLDLNRDYIWICSMFHPDETYPVREKPTGTEPGGGGVNPAQFIRWALNGTVYEQDPCVNAGKFFFSGFTTSRNSVPQKCSYHIDFGDGTTTSPDPVSNYGVNEALLLTIEHQYAPGNYIATVTVKSVSPFNSSATVVKTRTYEINAHTPQPTCVADFKYLQSLEHINSTTDLKGAIRFETWDPFLAGKRSRVSGWTELHQKDANGYWNRVKNSNTNLKVKITYSLRADDCDYIPGVPYSISKEENNSNTNRKEIKYTYGTYLDEYRKLQEIKGEHSFTQGSLSGSFTHSIVVCQ